MADPNKLQIDLREAIKEVILKICGEHGLDDTKIHYRLDLNAVYEIEDEIIKTGEN